MKQSDIMGLDFEKKLITFVLISLFLDNNRKNKRFKIRYTCKINTMTGGIKQDIHV